MVALGGGTGWWVAIERWPSLRCGSGGCGIRMSRIDEIAFGSGWVVVVAVNSGRAVCRGDAGVSGDLDPTAG